MHIAAEGYFLQPKDAQNGQHSSFVAEWSEFTLNSLQWYPATIMWTIWLQWWQKTDNQLSSFLFFGDNADHQDWLPHTMLAPINYITGYAS